MTVGRLKGRMYVLKMKLCVYVSVCLFPFLYIYIYICDLRNAVWRRGVRGGNT